MGRRRKLNFNKYIVYGYIDTAVYNLKNKMKVSAKKINTKQKGCGKIQNTFTPHKRITYLITQQIITNKSDFFEK